jgi:phosphoribosylformimino-5-aminoimidazole carboxamide ribonucleotide (ProFAR) isomerase
MLIPCIDLQSGQAVQLVRGRRRELALPDVFAQLDRFSGYSWLHIIDLDAAMDTGHNNALVEALAMRARRKYRMKLRVGGGVRTVARAKRLIRCGATQIIIGSAAFSDGLLNLRFLRALNRSVPPRRIVIALDALGGRTSTHGWRRSLASHPRELMPSLEPFCSAFLCTDVDREGTLSGANLEYFASLRQATTHPIIAAGGIRTYREVSSLEKLRMDAAVGMALYKNLLR